MTKQWSVDTDGMWLMGNETLDALRKAGYYPGVNKVSDVKYTYTLHRIEGKVGEPNTKFPIIYETTDRDELNRYVNLILGPRPEREG